MSGTPAALAASAALALGGCAAVGPDYARPRLPLPATFANAPAGESAAALSSWWGKYGDPVLADLVDRGVRGNLDVARAGERIEEARALRQVARAGGRPVVGVGASASRSRTAGRTSGLYEAGFDASWELDLFGGIRRSVEAAEASLDAARERRRDVLVTLIAEVARNYFELRGAQARLGYARANLVTQRETVRLTRARFRVGSVSDLDVQRSVAQAESTAAAIPALEQVERASVHRIGVLLGLAPAALAPVLLVPRAISVPADEVAGGAPADLLRRRPDVRAAERVLAAETAEIGVATADLYPRLSLSGAIGALVSTFSNLSLERALTWSAGAAGDLALLDGGARRGRVRVEEAQAREAALAYRATVLQAFEEAENGFVAYAAERRRLATLTASVRAYARAASLSRRLYRVGETDFLTVLDAERQLFTAQDALATSQTLVTTNQVALFKALGGGWEASEPLLAQRTAP